MDISVFTWISAALLKPTLEWAQNLGKRVN